MRSLNWAPWPAGLPWASWCSLRYLGHRLLKDIQGLPQRPPDPSRFRYSSALRAALLIVISVALSKYVLGHIFRKIARMPELMLVASGVELPHLRPSRSFNLSLEMGALIAGVAISTFPYNLDIISKIVNIRDFFITRCSLWPWGWKFPTRRPTWECSWWRGRQPSFSSPPGSCRYYPILYFLKNGKPGEPPDLH